MAISKIVLERDECTVCEACVANCQDVFEMADDGLAHLKDSVPVGSTTRNWISMSSDVPRRLQTHAR